MTQPKDSVLQAAAELFQARGVNNTTVQDITQAAGIAKGAFYQHFESKDALILALVNQLHDDILHAATPLASEHTGSPLEWLQSTISAELKVSTNYQKLLHAVAIEFPPNSTGAVPETIDNFHRRLYAWHKRILTEAFGARVDAYLDDLVFVLEGSINHYLVRFFWLGSAPPISRIAAFITQSLNAIVQHDEHLTPAFSHTWQDNIDRHQQLEAVIDQLNNLRTTVRQTTRAISTRDNDLAAINLVLAELTENTPREFLVDALLAQLKTRDYLTTELTSALTSWNNWKGTPR